MTYASYIAAPGLLVNYKAHQLPAMVLRETCLYLGLSEADVLSPSRLRPLFEARMICMYLLRNKGKMTHKEIAEFLGDRHHTSCIHALHTADDLLATDPEFEKKVQAVRRLL